MLDDFLVKFTLLVFSCFLFFFQQAKKNEMLNDDGDDVEEEERMKRKREEQIEKERDERLKHLNEWKVTNTQTVCVIFITIMIVILLFRG